MTSNAPQMSEFPEEGPPASDKPKPVVNSGPRIPAGNIGNDDAEAKGLDKEEAIAKVEEVFSSATIKKFEDAKWNIKQEGFADLQKEILDKQIGQADVIEACAKFIKAKMKDWKESNINLQKAIIGFFAFISLNLEKISKRTMAVGFSFFVDRIGDVKLSAAIKEMLLNASEIVTPKFVSMQVCKFAEKAKAPNNIKESCNILTDLLEQFGQCAVDLKAWVDFGKEAAGHANPQARQAAIKMFC